MTEHRTIRRVSRLAVLVGLAMALALALPGSTEAISVSEVAKFGAPDIPSFHQFGQSVSISGETAIAGAPLEDSAGDKAGAAYVFVRDQGGANNWGPVTKLTSPDTDEFDQFGYSVAVSGDTAVVAAPTEDDGAGLGGAAYIFQRDEGGPDNWGQVAKLAATDPLANAWFGRDVDISGDTAIVADAFEFAAGMYAGAVFVFQRDQGGADNWGQVAKLTTSDIPTVVEFGEDVAISGDIVVAGALGDSEGGSFAGAAYVFQRDHGGTDNWDEVIKLTASDAQAQDVLGKGVAVSGDTVLVGAAGEDEAGNNAGAAYLFQRNEGGTDNWGEVTKLTASDAEEGDLFGSRLAISGSHAIVAASSSGVVYAFQRDEGGADNWGEVTKLVASDGGAQFGRSAAISANTAVVGARSAGYVFDLLELKPTLTPTPTVTPTPTKTPGPVGGIALDSDLRALPLETTGPDSPPWGIALMIVAAVCLVAAAGAATYTRRHWLT